MARRRATVRLVPEREDISRSKKLGDEASPGQPDRRTTPSGEAEATGPAVAEQSVLEPVATPVAEGRPRGGLVSLLSRISTDPLVVHDAWQDLCSMIEEVVGREIRALEKRIGAEIRAVEANVMSKVSAVMSKVGAVEAKLMSKVDAVEAKVGAVEAKVGAVEAKLSSELDVLRSEVKSLRAEFVMMRWVLGILVAVNIAMLAMVVSMFIFFVNDRMDSRPEFNPVEQTRGATLPASGDVVADEPPASVSASDLGIDTEPAEPPTDEDSPSTPDTR